MACRAPALENNRKRRRNEVRLSDGNDFFVYFGTYTGFRYTKRGVPTGRSRSQGIYVARFDTATGGVSDPRLAAEIPNPSFVAIHPNRCFLYAVSEDPLSLGPSRDRASYVSAFAIDAVTGKLRVLNTVPTGGTSTCYLSLDRSGKRLLLANFGSGSVSVLEVRAGGSLRSMTSFIQHIGKGTHPRYQTMPHPHWIGVSPDNRFAIAADLGLDKVFVYRFNPSTGTLAPPEPRFVTVAPTSGPRHFAFAPDGKHGYLLNEMGGNVTAFAWSPSRGDLTQFQDVPTIPSGFDGENHSAEIVISPDGRFLYESNRRRRDGGRLFGPDTIGVYRVDPAKGTLTEVEQRLSGGIMPRSIAVDPSGSYLFAAHQLTGNVVVFRIAGDTGSLTRTRTTLMVPTPVCMKFVSVRDRRRA
ncbi:MAG: lactonase family protein [Terriglobia bacterium]